MRRAQGLAARAKHGHDSVRAATPYRPSYALAVTPGASTRSNDTPCTGCPRSEAVTLRANALRSRRRSSAASVGRRIASVDERGRVTGRARSLTLVQRVVGVAVMHYSVQTHVLWRCKNSRLEEQVLQADNDRRETQHLPEQQSQLAHPSSHLQVPCSPASSPLSGCSCRIASTISRDRTARPSPWTHRHTFPSRSKFG